jgi:glycosyltransferase involved in cell wall biosynthesis
MLSFIVPAFNEEFELPGSLAAIRSAAEDAGQAFEIIVVDDSSTDGTATIAQEHGARVLSIQARHIAAARNAGAKVSSGDILFFVDADTRITAAHLTAALAALEQGCAGGSARMQFDHAVPLWARLFLPLFSAIYFGSNLGAGAFLFTTRQNFFAAGGFDEQFFAGEETFLSMALKKFGPFRILREPVITSGRKVRMHRGREILGKMLVLLFGGPRVLRSREKLDLWYDGKREGTAA